MRVTAITPQGERAVVLSDPRSELEPRAIDARIDGAELIRLKGDDLMTATALCFDIASVVGRSDSAPGTPEAMRTCIKMPEGSK
jgi:hypothetical protein